MTLPNIARARHDAIVVVPCYNERERLHPETFVRFVRHHPEVGFLFVDDGSTDNTREILRALCDSAPASIRCITMERNTGKGEAVRRGLLEALNDQGVRWVGFWDADLSTPLETISSFVAVLEANPSLMLVTGARVQLLGRSIVRRAARHYLGRVFATAASVTLRLAVYDTQCGAKLFRAGELTRDILREPFGTGWIFDVEILARMIRFDRRANGPGVANIVYEFPLLQWHDSAGTKRRLRDYVRAARDLLFVHQRYMRD